MPTSATMVELRVKALLDTPNSSVTEIRYCVAVALMIGEVRAHINAQPKHITHA
jgi:hypothetical protein